MSASNTGDFHYEYRQNLCRAACSGFSEYILIPNAKRNHSLYAAVAFRHFGMDKVMVCDHSDFRLKLAEKLGFATCNPSRENFEKKAKTYFGNPHRK